MAGNSVNLVFKEGEDAFNYDPLLRSHLELEGNIRDGIPLEVLVNGLHNSFANISKGLWKMMNTMTDVLAALSDAQPKAPRPGDRRWMVEVAPSREEATPLGHTQQDGGGNRSHNKYTIASSLGWVPLPYANSHTKDMHFNTWY
jgi:hypothetical protein